MKNLIELKSYNNVVVLPHDNADVDSIISGVLMDRLNNFLGIKSRFCILDEKINKASAKLVLNYGIDVNEYQGTLSGKEMLFLVDHNQTVHGSDKVIGVVDHHPTIKENNYEYYLNSACSATAKHVYDLMVLYNFPIDKKIIEQVIIAMCVDTCSLRSDKARLVDKIWIKSMCEEYNLDIERYLTDGLMLTDLDNMLIKDAGCNGEKFYRFAKKYNVRSSYIQVINVEKYEGNIKSILRYISDEMSASDLDLWVFLVFDFKTNSTLEYQIKNGVCKKIYHNSILSRGKDIMPKIEKYYYGLEK